MVVIKYDLCLLVTKQIKTPFKAVNCVLKYYIINNTSNEFESTGTFCDRNLKRE